MVFCSGTRDATIDRSLVVWVLLYIKGAKITWSKLLSEITADCRANRFIWPVPAFAFIRSKRLDVTMFAVVGRTLLDSGCFCLRIE